MVVGFAEPVSTEIDDPAVERLLEEGDVVIPIIASNVLASDEWRVADDRVSFRPVNLEGIRFPDGRQIV